MQINRLYSIIKKASGARSSRIQIIQVCIISMWTNGLFFVGSGKTVDEDVVRRIDRPICRGLPGDTQRHTRRHRHHPRRKSSAASRNYYSRLVLRFLNVANEWMDE